MSPEVAAVLQAVCQLAQAGLAPSQVAEMVFDAMRQEKFYILTHPTTKQWVQLRMEDRAGRMWNLVGFQTRLRYPEQQRVFRMIPGLEEAEFLRFGSIHRNSYINAPAALSPTLALRDAPTTLFAGQLTGVEGYTESTATGLLAGINLDRMLRGDEPVLPPPTTMLGALYRYLRDADPKHFQPMNANFGLVDELPGRVKDKRVKREKLAERALADMAAFAGGVVASASDVILSAAKDPSE